MRFVAEQGGTQFFMIGQVLKAAPVSNLPALKPGKLMKSFYTIIFLLIALFYSSCAAVEAIFKAGVWVGVLIVVAIIALAIYIIMRFTNRR
jgi:hypothetical protein